MKRPAGRSAAGQEDTAIPYVESATMPYSIAS